MGKVIWAALAVVLSFTMDLVSTPILNDYPARCKRALRDLDCQGVSVAIVQNDQVIFVDGFGFRDQLSLDPVDEKTVFAIGSITKSMITAVIAMLVQEEKLDWNDHVRQYLPELKLFDQWVGEEIRVCDLLCHWVGLQDHAGDLLFLNLSHEEMFERLDQLKPISGFRTSFAYQNLLYLVAGRLIEKVSGETWEELVKERLLDPIGMGGTHTNISKISSLDNIALGHVPLNDGWHRVKWEDQVDFGPAGSVTSNAWEMAQWIRLVLRPGSRGGWPNWDLKTCQNPQVFLPMNSWVRRLYRGAHFVGCGMGWFSFDYFGHKVLEHSGNLPGLSAKIAFVPDKQIGIIVLCNQHESLLPHALVMEALDRLLQTPSVDWIRRMALLSPKRKNVKDLFKRIALPSSKGAELSGSYHNQMIGKVEISLEDGIPVLNYGRMAKGDLSSLGGDRYRVLWRQPIPRLIPGDLPLSILRDPSGEIAGIRIETLAAFTKESW